MTNAIRNLTAFIGYACGTGAKHTGCSEGAPYLLQQFPELFKSMKILRPENLLDNAGNKYNIISKLCLQLALLTQEKVENKEFFTVIGGDHSCAIGTWSGVAQGLRQKEKTAELGLIWIDAHLDAHTSDTTPSGNIHGMPVAALLGYGDSLLTHLLNKSPKIKPENICYIGARSYEQEEQALINKLKIKVFYMADIQAQGLESILQQAKKIVSKNTAAYGISIDLDSLDPIEAPGVGTPEKNGLHAEELSKVLQQYFEPEKNKNFCGLEIVEFNPFRDIEQKTEKIIMLLFNLFKIL